MAERCGQARALARAEVRAKRAAGEDRVFRRVEEYVGKQATANRITTGLSSSWSIELPPLLATTGSL